MPDQALAGVRAREAARWRKLAGQEYLLRLWPLPGEPPALGPRRAQNPAETKAIQKSLPLSALMTVQITPLTTHPGDPGLAAL